MKLPFLWLKTRPPATSYDSTCVKVLLTFSFPTSLWVSSFSTLGAALSCQGEGMGVRNGQFGAFLDCRPVC